MNRTTEYKVVPTSLSIFILINLISNTQSNGDIIPLTNRHHPPKNINFPTDSNEKTEFLIKRSADQNDDFMNSPIMKDFEMRLYQNQQQETPNLNSKLVDLQPQIQQRQLMNGAQSGYGEPTRLPFNSLYPYIGSKFLSLFPRKTFHLNPYNPFPFLPNLIPSLSYLPYSSPTYGNPWSWGNHPYYSPFQYQYNNYNRYTQPETNNGYKDYSPS